MCTKDHAVIQWPFSTKDTQDVLAGAFGGAVRWGTLRVPFWQGILSVFIGAVCAYYFSGIGDYITGLVFGPFIDPQAKSDAPPLGEFMTGVAGMSLAGFVVGMVQAQLSNQQKDNSP